MKILLLSSGPSLTETFDGNTSAYDEVIGVTIAPTLYPCDWWVLGDDAVFKHFRDLVVPPKGLFIKKPIAKHKGPSWFPEERRWLDKQDPFYWDRITNRGFYSGVAALALAVWILETDTQPGQERLIDVYGVDHCGVMDCHGRDGTRFRKPERWEKQIRQWDSVVADAEAIGVEINVHQPAEVPA